MATKNKKKKPTAARNRATIRAGAKVLKRKGTVAAGVKRKRKKVR